MNLGELVESNPILLAKDSFSLDNPFFLSKAEVRQPYKSIRIEEKIFWPVNSISFIRLSPKFKHFVTRKL